MNGSVFIRYEILIFFKSVYGRVMGKKRQGAVVLLLLIHPVGHRDGTTKEPVNIENDL